MLTSVVSRFTSFQVRRRRRAAEVKKIA